MAKNNFAPSINGYQLKNIFRCVIKLKENNINYNIMLNGHCGVGKTSIISQVSKANGYEFVILNLHTQTPEDLMGLPYADGNVQRYRIPDWLDRVYKSDKAVILLDEFSRGKHDVQQCMMTFLNERRIHSHHIRTQDIILSADNLDTPEYNISPLCDRAMTSRMGQYYFEPTVDEWMTYAVSKQIKNNSNTRKSNAMLSTISSSPKNLGPINISADDKTLEIIPNPRSCDLVDDILNALDVNDIKEFGMYLINSLIGSDVGSRVYAEYIEEQKKNKIINFDDILSGMWKNKVSKDIIGGYIFDPIILSLIIDEFMSKLDKVFVIDSKAIKITSIPLHIKQHEHDNIKEFAASLKSEMVAAVMTKLNRAVPTYKINVKPHIIIPAILTEIFSESVLRETVSAGLGELKK